MGPALQQIFCRAGPVCPAEGAVRNGGQENPAPTDRLMVRWDGPMWASAPTERLPIESHIALHGRRSGFHCLDGQHKRGAHRGCRRRGNAKARNEICSFPFVRRKRTRCRQHPARGKDFKTLVLAAFSPPFLSLQKEREPPEAFTGTGGCGASPGSGLWAARPTELYYGALSTHKSF